MAKKDRNYIRLGELRESKNDEGGHWISFCTQLEDSVDGEPELKTVKTENGSFQVDGILLRDSRSNEYFYLKSANISDRFVTDDEAERGIIGHLIVKKGGKALVKLNI